VGELASRTRAALQRARPLFRTADEVADIARRLDRVEQDVAQLAHPSRLAQIPHLFPRELAELRAEWRRHADTFEDWQSTLAERATELETVRNELVELRRSWADLRRAFEATGGPEARRQRIADALEAIRSADDRLEAQLEQVLALQERVSELSVTAQDVFEQLRAASAAYRQRVFVRDRPPIWIGLRGRNDASLLEQAHASWSLRTDGIGELLASHLAAFGRLLAPFVVLSVLLLLLNRRIRSWPADEALRVARTIAGRPFSTALLVTLGIAPMVVRHAPLVLYDAVFFCMVLPLIRVLPSLAPLPVRPLIFFLVGFLVVNRIEFMVAHGDGLDRLVLLAESAIVPLGVGSWIARVARERDRVTMTVRRLAAAIPIVLGSALMANGLGYVFLAAVLVRGTGFSVYAALVLVTLVAVALGLLDLAIRSDVARQLRIVREYGPLLHARVKKVLGVAAVLAWIIATLMGFGLWQPVSRWGETLLEHRWRLGTLEIRLGAIGLALLVVVITFAVARFVRFVLELDVLPRMRLEPGVEGAISGLTRYVIVGSGLLLALASLGIDASHIALVAGALGVGVGFGLQGLVANFIAGIVLMLERPVRLGDFIEVGDLIGRVERIGFRSSTVRALDGAEVIVPNESLLSREVINWTLSDRKRRVRVKVGVAYGSDPHRVLEVLKRVAEAHAGVLRGPPPQVLFEGFGDSSLNFVLQFWIDADFRTGLEIQSGVTIAVHDALKAEGIEIPFPQRDVHVKSLPASFPMRASSS
jgi:small-conductance mechanosensitive channel